MEKSTVTPGPIDKRYYHLLKNQKIFTENQTTPFIEMLKIMETGKTLGQNILGSERHARRGVPDSKLYVNCLNYGLWQLLSSLKIKK